MPQLRPMSTGEILDRTFSNYRRNFKLFAGIAAIPAAVLLVLKLLIVLVGAANSWMPDPRTARGVNDAALTFTIVTSIVTGILYLLALAVSQGATAYAVSAVHLEIPTSIRECYGRIKGRYGRMVNVIISIYIRVFGVLVISYLLIFLSVFIPGAGGSSTATAVSIAIVALVGIVVGLFLAIRLFARYSLAVPACVVEDIKARAAIKRSVFLSKGSIGKILAIYVLVLVINLVVGFGVALPTQAMVLAAKTTAVRTLGVVLQDVESFIVGSIVGPLATIALSLVYFDERVRKEAFDIQYMMQSLPQAPPVEAAATAPTAAEIAASAGAEAAAPAAQVQPEPPVVLEAQIQKPEESGTTNS